MSLSEHRKDEITAAALPARPDPSLYHRMEAAEAAITELRREVAALRDAAAEADEDAEDMASRPPPPPPPSEPAPGCLGGEGKALKPRP